MKTIASPLPPGSTVGILGGGEAGRDFAVAAASSACSGRLSTFCGPATAAGIVAGDLVTPRANPRI